MSTERDELISRIMFAFSSVDDAYALERLADWVEASYVRKPRVVTAAEELDALPVGSVVLNERGDAWRRGGRNWYLTGADGGRKDVPYPPFTVLHVGAQP